MTLPVHPFVTSDGADVLLQDPTQAPQVVNTYLGGDAPTVPPPSTEPPPPGPSPTVIGLTPC
jgi:hypothetical protein